MNKRIALIAVSAFLTVTLIVIFISILAQRAKEDNYQKSITVQKEITLRSEIAGFFKDYSLTLQNIDFEKLQKSYIDAANESIDSEYDNKTPLNIDLQGLENYFLPEVLEDGQKTAEAISFVMYFSPQMGVKTDNTFYVDESKIIIDSDNSGNVPPESIEVHSKNGKISNVKPSKYSSGTKLYPVFVIKTTDGWKIDFNKTQEYFSKNS